MSAFRDLCEGLPLPIEEGRILVYGRNLVDREADERLDRFAALAVNHVERLVGGLRRICNTADAGIKGAHGSQGDRLMHILKSARALLSEIERAAGGER